MKIYKSIVISLAACLSVTACQDLNLESKGHIDETALFSADYGVKKYLAKLYDDMPFEDWNYFECDNDGQRGYAGINPLESHGSGRAHRFAASKNSPTGVSGECLSWGKKYGSGYTFWLYDYIRDVNTFLADFPNYADNYKKEDADNYMGEAYFLRAIYYFAMVKRMGGVPLVTEPLDPTADVSVNALPRNTEYESWKLIHDDLMRAKELCNYNNGDFRANKYVAAALDTRVSLYAATTALYNPYYKVDGPATQAGLMKMEGEDIAKEFLEYALESAKFVNQGPYGLHTAADKAIGFAEIFYLETEENILTRPGLYANSADEQCWHFQNSWDSTVLPKGEGLSPNWGAMLRPSFESIDLYEHPALEDENGYPVRFKNREDFWQSPEIESRLLGTMFFSGMVEPASGVAFDFQNGIYKTCNLTMEELTPDSNGEDNPYIAENRMISNNPGEVIGGQKITGIHGGANVSEGYCHGSSCIRKYVDPTAAPGERLIEKGKLPYKLIRYGEVVCNEMEAAYELYRLTGNTTYFDEAQQCLNRLRDRAGAKPHQLVAGGGEDVGSELYGIPIDENLQYIRDERGRELMFEIHRMYDLRRWRIFDKWADNLWLHCLCTYYVVDEDAYIMIPERDWISNVRLTFNKKYYYEQIKYENVNPNMIKNDGY